MPPSKTLRERIALLVIQLAIIFGIPLLYLRCRAMLAPPRPIHFAADLKEPLSLNRPDYVFIGNSMLFSRINPTLLSTVTHRKVELVGAGGTGSAHWYLFFKNIVLPSGAKPRVVFFFFRDEDWTEPRQHLEAPMGVERLRSLMDGQEPELHALLDEPLPSVVGNVRRWLTGWNVQYGAREEAREKLRHTAVRLAGLQGLPFHQQMAEMNLVLNFNLLRPGEGRSSSGKTHTSFRQAVHQSFLPALLRLARRSQTSVLFVRVQNRPDPNDAVTTPETEAYIHEMREYLKTENSDLYDFTGDNELTLARYGEGHHVADAERDWHTVFFHRKLRSYFR